MSATALFHGARHITADAGDTLGAPLSIHIGDGSRVTLFTGDHALTRKLADAINAVMAEHDKQEAA